MVVSFMDRNEAGGESGETNFSSSARSRRPSLGRWHLSEGPRDRTRPCTSQGRAVKATGRANTEGLAWEIWTAKQAPWVAVSRGGKSRCQGLKLGWRTLGTSGGHCNEPACRSEREAKWRRAGAQGVVGCHAGQRLKRARPRATNTARTVPAEGATGFGGGQLSGAAPPGVRTHENWEVGLAPRGETDAGRKPPSRSSTGEDPWRGRGQVPRRAERGSSDRQRWENAI